VSTTEAADRVITQGRALVRAIEVVSTIEATRPFERAIASLLLTAYKRRLRAAIAVAPAWMGERILSASEAISEDRPAVWMSDN
jgi:hypothetical protein